MKFFNRNRQVFILTIVIVVIVISLIGLYFLFSHRFVFVTADTVKITGKQQNIANYKQQEASVILAVSDQELYFYSRMYPASQDQTKYSRWLSVFRDGSAERLVEFKNEGVLTIHNGYAYYVKGAKDKQASLNGYHLLTGETTLLATPQWASRQNIYYTEDGMLYIPVDQKSLVYRSVLENTLGADTLHGEEYILNGNTYQVENRDGKHEIVCYDRLGSERILSKEIPYGTKSLIPCKQGLLVHNQQQGDLLYLIREDTEEIIELFTVECMVSVSAVNIHEDQVFLSFKRYEKHGEFGMLRFEDDTLEGTYRIDLNTYSIQKITDSIYNGLYIFDDTGIYACDEYCNIYLLDFDGNIISVLLEQYRAVDYLKREGEFLSIASSNVPDDPNP